ncbi:MAG: ribulose-phosphate 3-epimerase [Anaerolineales bacterium]|nr:ribulose-phosphate 3-epimerase [Anaerolineales bacterium]
MKPYILAPSIIASDFANISKELAACETAGADWIHVDVMDGHFVPTITIGPLFVESLKRATKLPLDVHLMIENPEAHVKSFAEAGATNITVHVEACRDVKKVIGQIKSLGCKAGITLKPSTSIKKIEPFLSMVDLVLVMSVPPGFSGQKFMPKMVERVKYLRKKLDEIHSKAHLEVDGGINLKTLPLMKSAGANAFVTGNAAFKHPKGAKVGIRELKNLLVKTKITA